MHYKPSARFFDRWYHPDAHMTREDWIYIAQLITVCIWAFAIGFFVGFLLV